MITTRELYRRTEVTRATLDHWRARGLMAPKDVGAHGEFMWDADDVAVARVLRVVMPMRRAHEAGRVLDSSALVRLVATVRAGKRGRVRIMPGVYLDLDEIAGDATHVGDMA